MLLAPKEKGQGGLEFGIILVLIIVGALFLIYGSGAFKVGPTAAATAGTVDQAHAFLMWVLNGFK